jgi:Domain of unknown function (DUF4062)
MLPHARQELSAMRRNAEDFAASSATPQQACLAGVRWAEAVILLLGGRYGDRQASGISPTHEEYREARERCPVLIFVERGAAYEPDQHEFLREVQGWTTGHYTASFSDADELRDAVTSASVTWNSPRRQVQLTKERCATGRKLFFPTYATMRRASR